MPKEKRLTDIQSSILKYYSSKPFNSLDHFVNSYLKNVSKSIEKPILRNMVIEMGLTFGTQPSNIIQIEQSIEDRLGCKRNNNTLKDSCVMFENDNEFVYGKVSGYDGKKDTIDYYYIKFDNPTQIYINGKLQTVKKLNNSISENFVKEAVQNFYNNSIRQKSATSKYYGSLDLDTIPIERDMCEIFCTSNNILYPPDLNTQLTLYIMYTQTFVLDVIHDFEYSTVGDIFIDNYIKNIKMVFRKLGINGDLSQIIKDVFNKWDEDPETSMQRNKGLEKDNADWYVTRIFFQRNYLRTQERLELVMQNILEKLKNDVYGIFQIYPRFSLSTLIQANNLKIEQMYKENLNTLMVFDVVGEASKTPILQSFIKSYLDLKNYSSFPRDDNGNPVTVSELLSLAHFYDKGSRENRFISDINHIKLFNNLDVTESFVFTDGNVKIPVTILKYQLIAKRFYHTTTAKYEEGDPIDTTAILKQFGENEWDTDNTNQNSATKFLKDKMNNKSDKEIIKLALFKFLGDKAKRDIAYQSKKINVIQNTLTDNFNVLFKSNDNLSAMIASLEIPGTIFTSNLTAEIGEGVEFMCVKNGSKLKQIIKNYDFEPIPYNKGQEKLNSRKRSNLGISSDLAVVSFGKKKGISLKQMNADIKYLLDL
jgi:hypothetical protein